MIGRSCACPVHAHRPRKIRLIVGEFLVSIDLTDERSSVIVVVVVGNGIIRLDGTHRAVRERRSI